MGHIKNGKVQYFPNAGGGTTTLGKMGLPATIEASEELKELRAKKLELEA